jgi:pSer/pThr/pTyr-binding forkhead associated (FHA) protein
MTQPFDAALVLGRASDCDIRVDDEYVSDHHARLTRDPLGVVWIEDLGSTNGTWVNGVKVYGPTPLTRGDTLRIGNTEQRV